MNPVRDLVNAFRSLSELPMAVAESLWPPCQLFAPLPALLPKRHIAPQHGRWTHTHQEVNMIVGDTGASLIQHHLRQKRSE